MLKFSALAAILICSYTSASAAIVTTPPKRSAQQEECIKENPNNHQGYLACIHAKKEEQKGEGRTMNIPANPSANDQNQPVQGR